MAQADATHQEPSQTEHLRGPEHRGPGLAPSWDRPRKTASAPVSRAQAGSILGQPDPGLWTCLLNLFIDQET